MPKVSVLIPAYNCTVYIDRALKSVLSQDYHEREILIIDDGSTDNLIDFLQDYLREGQLKYIRIENNGVSYALNTGLRLAAGDYICFLHADDMFMPGKIKKQVSLMERYQKYDASYTNENYFLEDPSKKIESPYFHFSGDIFYFLKRSNFTHISTTMFRRHVFTLAQFDEGLVCHEDWDFFLKLSAQGIRFKYLDEVLSNICVHPKSLSFNTALMNATRSEVGNRAKELWYALKRNANIYSAYGISNLSRYTASKIYARIINFPERACFNRPTPHDLLCAQYSPR